MHNLKEIRKDFDTFKKKLEILSANVDFDKLKDLDVQNRDFIQKKETLEKEKKDISKSKDKSLFSKSKEISKSIDEITEKQKQIKLSLDNILSNIPEQIDVVISVDRYRGQYKMKIENNDTVETITNRAMKGVDPHNRQLMYSAFIFILLFEYVWEMFDLAQE